MLGSIASGWASGLPPTTQAFISQLTKLRKFRIFKRCSQEQHPAHCGTCSLIRSKGGCPGPNPGVPDYSQQHEERMVKGLGNGATAGKPRPCRQLTWKCPASWSFTSSSSTRIPPPTNHVSGSLMRVCSQNPHDPDPCGLCAAADPCSRLPCPLLPQSASNTPGQQCPQVPSQGRSSPFPVSVSPLPPVPMTFLI